MKTMLRVVVVMVIISVIIGIMFVINNYNKINEEENIGLIEGDFELIINKSNSNQDEAIKISTGEIKRLYKYDIYYYGIESIDIKSGNTTIDLKEALLNGNITIEKIIEKAEKDTQKGIVETTLMMGNNTLYEYDTSYMMRCGGYEFDKKMYFYSYDNVKSIESNKFELIINKSNSDDVISIRTGGIEKLYSYDICYKGIESIDVKFEDTTIDLKEALLDKKITMEEIIEKAEKDEKKWIIDTDGLDDGGTKFYYYSTYNITKDKDMSKWESDGYDSVLFWVE